MTSPDTPSLLDQAHTETHTAAVFSAVRVVLVRTSHPGNIGGAARAMKTMGLSKLWLVAPEAFPDPVAHARASGADDLLAAAHVVPDLACALEGCVYSLAMSARKRHLSRVFLEPREAVSLLCERGLQGDVALVFGNEASGLSNEELALCHQPVSIPVSPDFRSLNLAAAVQIMAYETRLALIEAQGTAVAPAPAPRRWASFEETEGFYGHLEHAAIACGFHNPAVPRHFMTRMRRLFGRAELEKEEVAILRGLLAALAPQPKD